MQLQINSKAIIYMLNWNITTYESHELPEHFRTENILCNFNIGRRNLFSHTSIHKNSSLPFFCLTSCFLFFSCSLPLKSDRPLCAGNIATTDKFQIESQLSYATGQHVIDDGYELEDEILCDNMDDDESNHSYVFLQQQQHYTPPPVEFQEGATPQHQTLIKKGSIMRNNPELMKRNRQNNS